MHATASFRTRCRRVGTSVPYDTTARGIWRRAILLSLLAACQREPVDPEPLPEPPVTPRVPVGLIWGSGASGAFVEDTVPLVVFFRDAADDPIGILPPVVAWTSSNPAVLKIVSDTLAVARATGTAVLTAVTPVPPAYTLDVSLEVIPRWQGRLVWSRQPAPNANPGIALQEYPGHEVQQLPDIGYPGTTSGDAYLSSDGRYAAATGTRPIAPGANSTIFVVDLVTGDNETPLDPLPGHQFSAAWFPGDTLLAFLARAVTGYEVFTARLDGSDVQQRTQLGQSVPPFFDVTPEGNLVLRLRSGPGRSDLFEVAFPGDTVRRLTITPDREETSPAVSRDGATIAYVTVEDDYSHVWLMNRDGTSPHRLLPDIKRVGGLIGPQYRARPANSISPSWTSDSEFVLVTWYIDPYLRPDGLAYEVNGDLYAIRLVDGLAIRLTRAPTLDGQPFFR